MKRMISTALLICLTVTIFAGCSKSMDTAAPYGSPRSESADYYSYEASLMEPDYEEVAEQESILPLLTEAANIGDNMIYEVWLQLPTTDFTTGNRGLLEIARARGGYVEQAYMEGRSLYSPDAVRYAEYTLRIPSEELTDFLAEMESGYNLWQLRQQAREVTGQLTYTDSRLESLRAQEIRLMATLAGELEGEDRLLIERELADVQRQIADLTAGQMQRERAVVYSTVYITLYEVNEKAIPVGGEDETFGDRIARAFETSIITLIAVAEDTVILVIMLLPLLAVIAVVALVGLGIYRLYKKRGRPIVERMRGTPGHMQESDEGDVCTPEE